MADTSFEFENIRTSSAPLPEQVAAQISQLIIDRHLSAEDKLPNEFELAAQLNVGRGTVREAVKLLAARNILEIRRGKGTYITRHPGEIDDPLGFAYYPDQLRLAIDLLEVRTQLEPWVAAVAARRAGDEELKTLWDNCMLAEQDILAGRDHLPNDKLFHISIAQCTQNLVVPKLIPVITYSVSLFGSLSGNTLAPDTIIGHRSIANAIRGHDPDAAARAMQAHLKSNRIELEQLMRENQEGAR